MRSYLKLAQVFSEILLLLNVLFTYNKNIYQKVCLQNILGRCKFSYIFFSFKSMFKFSLMLIETVQRYVSDIHLRSMVCKKNTWKRFYVHSCYNTTIKFKFYLLLCILSFILCFLSKHFLKRDVAKQVLIHNLFRVYCIVK